MNLEREFQEMLATHRVDTQAPAPPRPWAFRYAPVLGAIDNHEIVAANGRFVGAVYSYGAAKLICDLANKGYGA